MKKVLVFLCLISVSLSSFAKTIDQQTAQSVAYNFYSAKTSVQGFSDLSLAYTGTSVLNGAVVADFYIFNRISLPGYVIVSADDNVMPILGYSRESGFLSDHINASFQYLLNNYKNQISYAIQNNINAPAHIAANWANLKEGNSGLRAARVTSPSDSVGPLLKTKWDQFNEYSTILTYNADCPYDAGASTPAQTVTGCVATAMAQVMKYWNWPDTGVGNVTYTQYPNPDGIPEQSANFAVPYYFDSMPTPFVSRANAHVAKLMYDAGVSVNMNYGTSAEDGSGATVTIAYSYGSPCAESALNTNWRYPSAKGYQRRHISQALWLDSMINEMNSARPVIYAGQGSAGGHCWVMDGFDNDSFFHFNWGWSGQQNGWFTVNNLNPGIGDTFNSNQEAIIRIIPDTPANYSSDTSTKATSAVTPVTTPGNTVVIYPNPAANTINVSFAGISVKEITITDIDGRTMQQFPAAGNTSSVTLSVTDLPDGLYMVRLQTGQGVITRKFIVAK